jgi:hypothetical protein
VIATVGHGFESEAMRPDDEVDAPFKQNIFFIAVCPKSNAPFFIKEELRGVSGEFEAIADETVLYPAAVRASFENTPEPVKRAYEQALRCYSSSAFEACALMCRRSLEALCRSQGVQSGNLDSKLKKLAEQRVIDARLAEWAHGIRIVGNEAAHDTDTELSKEDAKDALDFTEALLTYVFVLNERFAAFSARRKQKGVA